MRAHNLKFFMGFAFILFHSISAQALERFDHQNSKWALTLKENVKSRGPFSAVDYKKLKSNSKDLEKYLADIQAVSKNQYESFSQDERLAFLINAYNALTLKLVLDNYPVASIKKIGGFFSSPWKIEFFTLLGEKQSLDKLENKLVREWFKDPRVLLALACAAKGCPALKPEPYSAKDLMQQLENAADKFLNDKTRNIYNDPRNIFEVSAIFNEHKADFETPTQTLQQFLARYMLDAKKLKPEALASSQVKYLVFDWSLNDK